MYNAYTTGTAVPSSVPAVPYQQALGSHFPQAPPAAFNVGPTSGAGMSIFGSTPAGELMSSPADDSLFAPAVAPITRAYAVIAGTSKPHMWLPKGMVVQISEVAVADTNIYQQYKAASPKAERAGHNIKRLLCEDCDDTTVIPYSTAEGVVGVLAEAVDVGTKATKAGGGYVTVTVAIENAAEIYVPPDLDAKHTAGTYKGGWTATFQTRAPTQTVTLQARIELNKFRAATVLNDWTLGDPVGIHACLHPQIYTCEIPNASGSGSDAFVASRASTQARMRRTGGAPAPVAAAAAVAL